MSTTNLLERPTASPQSYYLFQYQTHSVSRSYYIMIVVINNIYYTICYKGSPVLGSAETVMKVLEDWGSRDVMTTLTYTRPELLNFMKFTSVNVLHDYIKSLICLDAL